MKKLIRPLVLAAFVLSFGSAASNAMPTGGGAPVPKTTSSFMPTGGGAPSPR